jgi:hypothetical protein
MFALWHSDQLPVAADVLVENVRTPAVEKNLIELVLHKGKKMTPAVKKSDIVSVADVVEVEWQIGSTHDSGARGPGFNSHSDANGLIGNLSSPSFRQHT